MEGNQESRRMFLDQRIIEAAKEAAKQLIAENKKSAEIIPDLDGTAIPSKFTVSKDTKDIFVLGSVIVEEETFFIGASKE